MKPHKCWKADSEKISSTKFKEISKSEFKNKEELKRLTREEEEKVKKDQDNKRRKKHQLLLLSNKLPLELLKKSQLKRRENQEEEDQEKVNNDQCILFKIKIININFNLIYRINWWK